MRRITALLLWLAMASSVGAQTMDTVLIVKKARKFKPREHILVMFELLDTIDASGKKISMSRSYYFDKGDRMISSVREYDNPRKPERGTQVVYSFSENNLTAVTVILPKSICRNCASRYYYSKDSLLSKQEDGYINADSGIFTKQAHYFQSKVPHDLPWGFFEDEVLVNGKRKKLKQSY
jgi:hypothetical protein